MIAKRRRRPASGRRNTRGWLASGWPGVLRFRGPDDDKGDGVSRPGEWDAGASAPGVLRPRPWRSPKFLQTGAAADGSSKGFSTETKLRSPGLLTISARITPTPAAGGGRRRGGWG